jgi:hypothetical protein
MAIRKRGAVWWVDITTPAGERLRRSAETGNQAASAAKPHLERRSPSTALRDHHKATHEHDKAKLRWLDQHLSGAPLEAINRSMVVASAIGSGSSARRPFASSRNPPSASGT